MATLTVNGSRPAHVDFKQGIIFCRDGFIRFRWEPSDFRLGIAYAQNQVRYDADAVYVLLDFIWAYLERPKEFRRTPEDYEQENRNWWINKFDINYVLNGNIEDHVEE